MPVPLENGARPLLILHPFPFCQARSAVRGCLACFTRASSSVPLSASKFPQHEAHHRICSIFVQNSTTRPAPIIGRSFSRLFPSNPTRWSSEIEGKAHSWIFRTNQSPTNSVWNLMCLVAILPPGLAVKPMFFICFLLLCSPFRAEPGRYSLLFI